MQLLFLNQLATTLNGEILANSYFQRYILSLGIGIILSGIIYFMDYKKICKYSLLIYMAGIILNIFCFISGDFNIEILYAILPFYGIAFTGFINEINQKKSNIIKTIVLSIISIALLRRAYKIMGFFIGMVYLIITTVKLSKLQKNRIKYLAMLWVIPIIILGIGTYERVIDAKMNPYTENGWTRRKR